MDSNEPIFLDWLPAITNCPDLHGYARFCMGMRGFTWVCAELRRYAQSCTDVQIFVCVCAFNFFQTILIFYHSIACLQLLMKANMLKISCFLQLSCNTTHFKPFFPNLKYSGIFSGIFRKILGYSKLFRYFSRILPGIFAGHMPEYFSP